MLLLTHNSEKGAAALPDILDILLRWVSLVEVTTVFLEGVQKGWVL